MSTHTERIQYIQHLIAQGKEVQVATLSQELEVSEMTIRRDLTELERLGVLRKVHGGAIKEVGKNLEPVFSMRLTHRHSEKNAIGKLAVNMVREGDTLAIDSGSTALAFAQQLVKMDNLIIVTPSIHIGMLFLHHPSTRVFLSGGELRQHEGSLVGDQTRKFFENLHFDKFFMSSAGIDHEYGLTEYDIDDATIKNNIISQSKSTIALMTDDKFNRTAFARVCFLKEINMLITNKWPQGPLMRALKDNKVDIQLVSTT